MFSFFKKKEVKPVSIQAEAYTKKNKDGFVIYINDQGQYQGCIQIKVVDRIASDFYFFPNNQNPEKGKPTKKGYSFYSASQWFSKETVRHEVKKQFKQINKELSKNVFEEVAL